jgi:hypothetical protein
MRPSQIEKSFAMCIYFIKHIVHILKFLKNLPFHTKANLGATFIFLYFYTLGVSWISLIVFVNEG